MKKRRCHIAVLYAVVCTALLFSCKDDKVDADVFADRCIYLRATVESAEATTRLPFPVDYQPNRERPLDVAIWASTTQNKFTHTDGANGKNGTVALHTSAHFTNSKEQLLDDAVYPKASNAAENAVYFIGLHPKTGWSTTDGAQATHASAIDGKTDVMFAPQISGRYGGNTTGDKWPTFEFHHLLTWLRIQMVAENEEVRDAWGKVTDLTIKSLRGVNIDLSEEYNSATCVTFTGEETDLSFYQTETDEVFPSSEGYELKAPYDADAKWEDYIEEVAYVLCAPVDATEKDTETGNKTTEYTLHVETEKRNVNVNVDLMESAGKHFTGPTMNKQFTLLLKFKMGDNISIMALPTDWQTGGISSGELEETE
ncbi:MAG: hypothetical protein IKK62_02385 [Bacteroidaceae bacterium]|nr:hypothetical protein [Bacteroidaceae bacterium]